MELKNNNKLTLENIKLKKHAIVLENIKYEGLDIKNGSFTISAYDKIEFSGINKNIAEFFLTTKLVVEPESLFNLEIKVKIMFSYSIEIKQISQNEVYEFFKNNASQLLNLTPVFEYMSLLVSQITSSFGRTPLILSRTIKNK